MKRLLYFAMAIITSLAFTACGDDNDGPSVSLNPQEDAAGTYSGTWTINIIKETTPVGEATTKETLYSGTPSGSVVLTAAAQYIADIEFVNDVLNEYMGDPLKGKINIAQTSNGYTLFNFASIKSAEDGIVGDGYGASISVNNELTISSFTRVEKVQEEVIIGYDRRNRPIYKVAEVKTTYDLSFTGVKQ